MVKASCYIALRMSQTEKEGGRKEEGEKEDGKNLPNFCNVKFLHSFYSQVMANNICSKLFKNHV
jgi:hypothetical protein